MLYFCIKAVEEGFFKNKNALKSIHYTLYGELICTNIVTKMILCFSKISHLRSICHLQEFTSNDTMLYLQVQFDEELVVDISLL